MAMKYAPIAYDVTRLSWLMGFALRRMAAYSLATRLRTGAATSRLVSLPKNQPIALSLIP